MARGGNRGRPKAQQWPPETPIVMASPTLTNSLVEDGIKQEETASSPSIAQVGRDTTVISGDGSSGRIQPPYTALVNPDEGTTLEYVPAQCINGVVCAKLDAADVEDEISYWQNAVLCCVLGANPPYGVIEGFIRRIWQARSID